MVMAFERRANPELFATSDLLMVHLNHAYNGDGH